MNEAQKQALQRRQRAMVEAQTRDDAPVDIGPPPPPLRPFADVVAESRPDVPAGIPISFMRFTSKSFQVPGQQSGEALKAVKLANEREHRIEYIAQMRHHMITYLDPTARKVEFAFVHESLVMTWTPA